MIDWQLYLSFLLFLDPSFPADYTTEHCSVFKTYLYDNDYNRIFYNKIFCSQVPTQEEIIDIQAFFGDIPYSWFVHTQDLEMQTFLLKHGLVKIPQSLPATPLMVLDLQKFYDEDDAYSDFIIQEINLYNKEEVRIWARCKFPTTCNIEDACQFLQTLFDRFQGSVKLYVGYYKSQPAITTMTIKHDDIVAIHSVFTGTEYRKRGLASMMLRKILYDAQHNDCKQAILLSSASGKSVYEKLGFQEQAQFFVYGNYLSEL